MMFTKRLPGVKSKAYPQKEEREVVKGTARRVVVVKSPDKKMFEEAIFIVREEYMRSPGITQAQLMKEARNAARGYVGRLRPSAKHSNALTALISAIAGSGISVLIMQIFGF